MTAGSVRTVTVPNPKYLTGDEMEREREGERLRFLIIIYLSFYTPHACLSETCDIIPNLKWLFIWVNTGSIC